MLDRLFVLIAPAMCLALAPATAFAQGFGIYEQGACVMSRGSAGVAEPCQDGAAIYINPAGLTGGPRMIFGGGVMPVFGSGSFTSDAGQRTDHDSVTAYVPHGYFAYGVNDKVTVGLGIYAPYGLGLRWPLEFDGRYVSYDSSLKTLYAQPTAAYAVNDRLSLGAGLTIGFGDVQLRRRVNLATVTLPNGTPLGLLVNDFTDFEDTELTSTWATGFGLNLGVIVKATDRLRFGARYLSKIGLDYDGRAEFTPLPGPYPVTKANPFGVPVGTPLDATVALIQSTLQSQQATTAIDMPAQFSVGMSAHATDRLSIFADYSWTGWSTFDSLTLDFVEASPADEVLVQNYRDTGALRLGADYLLSPSLRVSGGYIYNSAAAPDETVTPLLPEASRSHLTAGAGWKAGTKFNVDVAYQLVLHADRRGRVVGPPPGQLPTVALNSGEYRARSDLVAITLSYRP